MFVDPSTCKLKPTSSFEYWGNQRAKQLLFPKYGNSPEFKQLDCLFCSPAKNTWSASLAGLRYTVRHLCCTEGYHKIYVVEVQRIAFKNTKIFKSINNMINYFHFIKNNLRLCMFISLVSVCYIKAPHVELRN